MINKSCIGPRSRLLHVGQNVGENSLLVCYIVGKSTLKDWVIWFNKYYRMIIVLSIDLTDQRIIDDSQSRLVLARPFPWMFNACMLNAFLIVRIILTTVKAIESFVLLFLQLWLQCWRYFSNRWDYRRRYRRLMAVNLHFCLRLARIKQIIRLIRIE